MELRPGTRVGSLEILGPLGSGGMGEVYRARDTRLGREVAVKVLPRATSHDASRLARFDREARLLATLNHPGIGMIYGVEDSAGDRLLVLELVPGQTLAQRIAAGPLPLVEALSICRQIAEAVAHAHASGVVHRDLKPANVMCTPDGRVKVLDFGLAKALAADTGAPEEHTADLPDLPTREDTLLGTPAYMSPEQARGATMDRRTDVWSFGCILYETLTRQRAFLRATRTDTLAAVLEQDPDWSALPAGTPSSIRTLLRRCLQRDRERRLHDMADVRIELEESLTSDAQPSASLAGQPAHGRPDARELAAAWVLALVVAANAVLLPHFVAPLAAFREEFDEELSLPLRIYIACASPWGALVLVILALLWGVGLARGPRFAGARRALLFTTAGLAFVASIAGLYVIAEEGVRSAVQQNFAIKGTFVNRELATLHVAAGEPRLALDILDPEHHRDYPREALVWWGVPGHVFQMAEAYRASGDVEAARNLYGRAREAATAFDESLSERALSRQEQWQKEYGLGSDWKLPVARVRMLPDVMRAVADQRLRELAAEHAPAAAAAPANR